MHTVQSGSECELWSMGEMEVENDGGAGPQAEWDRPHHSPVPHADKYTALTAEQRVIYGEEC